MAFICGQAAAVSGGTPTRVATSKATPLRAPPPRMQKSASGNALVMSSKPAAVRAPSPEQPDDDLLMSPDVEAWMTVGHSKLWDQARGPRRKTEAAAAAAAAVAGPLRDGMEVLKISGELLLGVVGNKTDPLQLAVATDRQGLWLAGEARVRRGTIAAQVCTLP